MSNELIVIGITGVARSGKDTIARILCSRFGFTRIALADGVRSAFRDMDGPTWELTKDLDGAAKTTRWALQNLGTEARLDVADLAENDAAHLFWVYLLAAKIMYLYRHHVFSQRLFVVPDVRFPYEQATLAKIVGNFDGTFRTWKAIRDGAGLSGSAGKHVSEVGIESIGDYLPIHNNGGLAELETIVSRHTRQLLEPSNELSRPLD